MLRSTTTLTAAFVLLAGGFTPGPQGGGAPGTPAGAQAPGKGQGATRPASRPATLPAPAAPSESGDLIQRFPAANPLLGVWKVQRTVSPVADPRLTVRGYVVFTHTHLSLHLVRTSVLPGGPLSFESSIRRYFLQGPLLRTTALLGLRSGQRPGTLFIEARGLVEQRRFLLVGPKLLRIYQGPQTYLELVKEAEL